MKGFRENHGRENPKRVVIYRNGASEGQFPNILKYEIPLVMHQLRQLNCDAKVTVIACNKLQGVRFFDTQVSLFFEQKETRGGGTIMETH